LLGVEFELFDQLGQFLIRHGGPLGPDLRHLRLAPLDQHALQPPDDDDGQDDVLVFVRLELSPQAFGGFPHLIGEVVELGFIQRE
jgi:hypothetical protein